MERPHEWDGLPSTQTAQSIHHCCAGNLVVRACPVVDNTVDSGFQLNQPWITWAMHSLPARVGKEQWPPQHSVPIVGPHFVQPIASPRRPPPTNPSVRLAQRPSAGAKRSGTLQNNCWSLPKSNRGRRCSTVITDAPPAAPLLADRTFFRHFPESREKGIRGLQLRISGSNGSRGRGGRFVSSFNFSNECVARRHPLLLSTFPPSCCSFLVVLGSGLQQRVPLSSREHIKPFTEFLFRDQPTPWRQVQQHPWDQKGRASTLCLGEQRHHSTLLPKHTGER